MRRKRDADIVNLINICQILRKYRIKGVKMKGYKGWRNYPMNSPIFLCPWVSNLYVFPLLMLYVDIFKNF